VATNKVVALFQCYQGFYAHGLAHIVLIQQ
jgi:hypothetical protein